MPRSYASSRPIYLQVFNTLYTVATLLFQTYWLFWSVPPQLYHHASLHWVSSHGQVIIIILTLLLVVVLIRIHHQIYDIILDHPGVVVVVTDLFLKSKVTSSIDRSGGGLFGNGTKVLLSVYNIKYNIKQVSDTFELDRMVFQSWLLIAMAVKGHHHLRGCHTQHIPS